MRATAAFLILGLVGGPLQAQDRREPTLPADHWSRAALLRLAALGAIPMVQAVRAWPIRRDEARRLLAEAAGGSDTAAARIARPQLEAFETEFARGGSNLALAFDGGWAGAEGMLLGGTSRRDESGAWLYPGPVPHAAANGAAARLAAEMSIGRALTLVAATRPHDGWASDEAWIGAGLGPIDLWAGRRTFSFGEGGGALVLSGDAAFDGAGLRTARTWTPPGLFSFLGEIDAAFLLARFERSGTVRHPWFGATRIVLSPGRGFTIGLNRAALFGGEGNVQATSLRNLLFLVGGLTSQLGKDSGWENQVASIDVRTRARFGGLPLVLHGEIAIDDVGFNLFRTAAFVTGIAAPAMPGLPALGLGLEHTRIPGSCCTQPPWYRHGDLGDGWTMGGRLLGHPLGGQGTEWALRADWSPSGAVLAAVLLARTRGKENLLAPDHRGSSLGGSLSATLPVTRDVVAAGTVTLERGADGWRVWQGRFGLRFRLRVTGGGPGIPVSAAGPPDPNRKEETEP
jgi:hypothetical protein